MEKVNGTPPVENDGYQASQRLALLIGNIIIILMMMCAAVGIVQFGTRLSPLWQGAYLVWLVMLITMEAIFTRKHARKLEGRARLIFHLSEWIAFAVAIKMLLYLVNDPTRFLEDLPRWQENFLENFFTGEYVLVLVICLGVWLLARTYAGELEELYERENDADWDELGKLQNALSEIRGKIASKVFFIGIGVVGLAVAARIDASALLRTGGQVTVAYHTPVVNVLFYFVLALVLLSQTQFALLRTRWRFQHLPITGGIARNWIRFGLLFFVVLAVVVFFLPTEYSLNLLDTPALRDGLPGPALHFPDDADPAAVYLVHVAVPLCQQPGARRTRVTAGLPAARRCCPRPAHRLAGVPALAVLLGHLHRHHFLRRALLPVTECSLVERHPRLPALPLGRGRAGWDMDLAQRRQPPAARLCAHQHAAHAAQKCWAAHPGHPPLFQPGTAEPA